MGKRIEALGGGRQVLSSLYIKFNSPNEGLQYHLLVNKQVCRFSLLSDQDVRWPRRMLSLLSNVEYADGMHTYRRTDGRTSDHYITLSAMNPFSVMKHY